MVRKHIVIYTAVHEEAVRKWEEERNGELVTSARWLDLRSCLFVNTNGSPYKWYSFC